MTRANLGVGVLASAALLLAGCGGGSSSSGVAHLSSSTSSDSPASGSGSSSPQESSASAQRELVAYAQCMRSHGVAEFPEPSEGRLLIKSSDHNGHVTGVNPRSSQFQTAQKACAKLQPNGGKPPSAAQQAKMQEGALNFSKCMRAHGVPNFPDPQTLSGGGVKMTLKAGGANGIDPNSPQFRDAQKACQSDLHLPGAKGGPAEGPPAGPPSGGASSQQSSNEVIAP